MGTTLTAAALVVDDGDERIAIANVGDSRAYVFTQGDLTQLTEDHSVPEELVRQGQLEPDEVDSHPQRHILTRAMGILPEVDVDLWEVLPYAGDRLLLCSDGLVREVTDDQIAAVLRRLADPGQAAQELVAKARANGGSDNITVVVIDVVDDDGRSLAASDALAGDHASEAGNVADEHEATFPATGAESEAIVGTPPRRRRVTFRSVLFVILLLAVLAGGAVAVVVYARDTYYVTLGAPGSGPQSLLETPGARPLIIYQGRPGGLLWFHPTLVDKTGVLSTQVLPARLPDLAKGQVEPSLGAARTYVANLLQEAARSAPPNPAFTTPSSTTPSSTTSTTAGAP
jgi:protein phosphatase